MVDDFHNPRATALFFKMLTFIAIIKILLLWSLGGQVIKYHDMSLPGSWWGKMLLAPAFLANERIDIFFAIVIAMLLVIFFFRRHYITTALFFWITFNLYIVYLPFANGADIVLFVLAFWCVPMAAYPQVKSAVGKDVQKAIYNASVLLCQLQVVFIYFVSGWDKLMSQAWRSGEAFSYITNLDTMFNPVFRNTFDHAAAQWMLSWTTILFELAFCFLVWFRQTRLPMLVVGVLFHLFIWIVLSLPDFACTMMVSYVLFLKDSEINRFKFFRRRQAVAT